jgi:hypothetical protein
MQGRFTELILRQAMQAKVLAKVEERRVASNRAKLRGNRDGDG